jgi:phytoene dehydrogenase-like protein
MGEIDGAFRAWGFQKGGTGAISESIASAARSFGAEVRVDADVARVLVKDGRTTGVALANGDEIAAPVVVSGLDPRRTFIDLIESKELPDDLVTSIRNYRFRGSSGKVNLALDALPDFTCLRDGIGGYRSPLLNTALRGAISISPSVDYLERAYDDAKYGEFSRHPYMDIIIPSMIDPAMAPPGKHVMSIFVQYVPYHLNGGWNDARREAFGDTVIDTLAQYAPNIRSAILHRQVITPADIERVVGLSEGNIFQGELTLQQMFFMRPVAGWARYRTPVRGLYQCGAATHPGGGVMGAAGRLAAAAILEDT